MAAGRLFRVPARCTDTKMPSEPQSACVATEAEIKAMKRQCWNPSCPRRAFIRDWKGWKWCFRCWWRQFEYKSLGHWVVELRYLRLF